MKKKVIVLGLDGFEPSLVEAMLDAEELPEFQKLRRTGCYRRLKTTCPAQTPVAWSSFATGTNPGGHGSSTSCAAIRKPIFRILR